MKKWIIILIVLVAVIIISAGIFAFYYFKADKIKPSNAPTSLTPSPKKEITIVALGDSLTQAANPSPELPGDHPEYSYSCGDKIESLAKIMAEDNYEVKCYNLSVSGATSESVLKNQIQEAKKYNPDLVVMTIGGNDAMQKLSSLVLKDNLTKIITNFPKAKILIGNIPNLEKFRENDYPACKVPLSQYRELEKLTGVYIMTYNLQLKTLENNGVKIIDLFNLLGKDDVSSYDCMHFSVSGQGKTAQAFYEATK
jgi:lysophospholipase L1-like esterase